MRFVALLVVLSACGDPRAANTGDEDGGTAGADGGPVSWAGTYDLGDLRTTLACDGGGTMTYAGLFNRHERIWPMVPADGGLRAAGESGPYIPVDDEGRVTSGRIEATTTTTAPDRTAGWPIYTAITGQFSAGPRRFDGTLTLDGWEGQCHGSVEAHWVEATDGGSFFP